MTTQLENKFSMYLAVQKLFDDNPTIVALIPPLPAAILQFAAIVSSINDEKSKQSQDILGFAANKLALRSTLESQLFNMSKRIVAYAASVDNITLESSVSINKSTVHHLPDTELNNYVDNISQAATDNLLALAPFSVTQQLIDDLQAAGVSFNAVLVDPRNAITARKVATSNLNSLFSQADTILKSKIDKYITLVSDSHPDFYNQYKQQRIIVDLGHHYVSLEGKVLDSATASPVEGVKVLLVESGLEITTRSTGHFRFKSLPAGNYTLQITAKNYQTQVLPNIPIVEGRDFYQIVRLERGTHDQLIHADSEISPWHGPTDTNLVIIVKNTSRNLSTIWAFITPNPDDLMPADKVILAPGAQHEFPVSEYQPAPIIYLRLRNTDTVNSASYTLQFSSIIE